MNQSRNRGAVNAAILAALILSGGSAGPAGWPAAAPVFAATANQRAAAAHFKRGLQLSTQSNWRGAEAEYRAALKLDPTNPTYNSYLSEALAAQGKFKNAKQSAVQE